MSDKHFMIQQPMSAIPGEAESSMKTFSYGCKFSDSIRIPLYDPHRSAPNPCFLASALLVFQAMSGVLVILQTLRLLFSNYHGPFRIKYSFGRAWSVESVGKLTLFRIHQAGLQAAVLALLGFLTYSSSAVGLYDSVVLQAIAASIAVNVFLVLPLHILEPTRSVVGHGSLLSFWLLSAVAWSIIAINDFVSPHKVFIPHNGKEEIALAFMFEIFLILNSFLLFYLENFYYKPSQELAEYFDLHGWDASTVKNLVQQLCFTWVNPLIADVYSTDAIDIEDVPNAEIGLQSDTNSVLFKKAWEKEVRRATRSRDKRVANKKKPTDEDKKIKPSLLLVILRLHGLAALKGLMLQFGEISANIATPFMLQAFILFFTKYALAKGTGKETPPLITGFVLSLAIYGVSVLRFLSFNQVHLTFFRLGYGVQSALTTAIYEKALKLSPDSRKKKNTGEVVNHVAVDVSVIADSLEVVSDGIVIPLRLGLCLGALYKLLGDSTWPGLAVALIMVPLASMVSAAISTLYQIQMKYKDERTRLTSEILNSIKSIKLYSWEKPMLKRLSEVRNDKELKNNKKLGIYHAGAWFAWDSIPFLIACAVYGFFGFFSEVPLTPAIMFPALSFFDQLSEPLEMIPSIFNEVVEAKVSLNRLEKYLMLEEMAEGVITRLDKPLSKGDTSVSIKNASFVWSQADFQKLPGERSYALRDINFTAKKGELTCLVGRVGAGKTTLLKSIIGEIPVAPNEASQLTLNGSVAYCSQNAWILNSSVRENIVFGRRFDREFYDKTVEACQLRPDFEVLPYGDSTLVGEKGISLSGGQRARLSLARAVYARADVYLLDDVLSAVDAHVGKRITNAVLSSSGLLATKTVILATNSVRVLKRASDIYYLRGGKIIEHGTHEELINQQGEISKLVSDFVGHERENSDEEVFSRETASEPDNEAPIAFEPTTTMEEDHSVEALPLQLARSPSRQTIGRASVVSLDHKYLFEDGFGKAQNEEENKEVLEKGKVKLAVYIEFIKACKYPFIIFWICVSIVTSLMEVYGKVILKVWSERNLEQGSNAHSGFYLSIFFSNGILAEMISFVNSYIIWTVCAIQCSKHFHDRMARSVMRSPMSFFDTTPVGRILNRFSEDVTILDGQILWTSINLYQVLLETILRVGIVVYNLPAMILVIAALAIIFLQFRSRYMPASRELTRLRSSLKSPVFSHLQESVNGAETLRAYGESDRFIHANKRKVDDVIKVSFVSQITNRWLSIRLHSISAFVVLASSLLTLMSLLISKKPFSPSMVGFLMTYVFSSTMYLNSIIRLWSEAEVRLVSIERLIEYANLPSEAPEVVESNRPDKSWPTLGSVTFKDYSTSYRPELPPVLKGINLDIKPSEKIGIVGRTGAGKSSLTLALFRMIEPTEGNINIDSVNTSEIGLHDLRGQLNIIPQDAHAFEGTVRQNLDPFDQYTDEELWQALELAHLKEHVESMKTERKDGGDKEVPTDRKNKRNGEEGETQSGLQAILHEGGSNLSSGQKQLLCLARALLKKSKVLVLDEATAAVDVQTDKIIQETIRSQFSDKTILTIAHRLDTIMDSDRVLVLDKGEVKEFDSPQTLIKDETSEFYSLCKEGGHLPRQA